MHHVNSTRSHQPLTSQPRTVHQTLTYHRLRPTIRATARHQEGEQDMAETRVQFQNTARHKLVGVFKDVPGSNNVVICCHGYAASKDGFVYAQLARALAARQLASLRFDFSGNGESEGAFEFGNYYQEVADLKCAVQYVRDVLHKKVVAIVGHSKGGNVVLLYASQHDDVPLVVNVAGRCYMDRGIKERFGDDVLAKLDRVGELPMTVKTDTGTTVKWLLTKKSLEQRLAIDMEAAARNISISEVLTCHGTADTVIPVSDSQALSKCIRQHCLWTCEGADHNFRNPSHADQLIRKIVEFISQGL